MLHLSKSSANNLLSTTSTSTSTLSSSSTSFSSFSSSSLHLPPPLPSPHIIKRIVKDLNELKTNPPEGIQLLLNEENITDIQAWILGSDLPDFPMLPPIPSPLTQGYRTKCEFSFGLNHDREKCIGFNAGAYLSGDLAVVPPDGLKHVHENMILGCRILQEYIDQSPYPVWDKKVGAGFFRLCLMRTSTLHENMFILQVDPMNLSDSELQSFETEFKAFFIQGAAKLDLRITVLGIQYYKGVHDQFSPIEPIHALVGDSLLIHETLLGCTFTISPTSFFQVNTGAAEQLYQVVQSWTSSSPQATLLDLCCGTGTIGICLASGFHQVIGIEIIDSAIQDAKKNALANQIDTIRFELGSVESVLPKLLKVIDGEMVAVLNPPRNGVHSSVIRAIRACKSIQKLVYISCNVKLASKNFIDLCRPESLSTQGTPFKVTRSVIVDMFPHTHHVETVIEFERTLQS
ncbi:tRNA methyltransferase 2 [Coelomomyces lativittatus]|nr:tRNA methyltransferase 2 [Coelomomyces lativittatus]